MLEIFENFFQKFSPIVSKNEKNCQKNGHLGPENGQKFAVFGSENKKIRQKFGMNPGFIVLLQVSKPQIIVYYSLDNMKVKSKFEFLPYDRSSVSTTKLLLQNQF